MPEPSERPQIVVVMGVSGSGKSTVAELIAAKTGWELLEGDNLHPAANIAKMAAGHPLTDEDRWPWLQAIAEWMTAQVGTGRSGVVTCFALKRAYRDIFRDSLAEFPHTRPTFVHLTGSRDELLRRMTTRPGHFMPAALLDSQLATLEDPASEPNVITLDIDSTPEELATAALANIRTGD
ncbi:gluconokinase [Nocardia crassostreae]|uniref:gluconokinase n=1 Tax=Nocardia crassostreae TaxID=53428 RepID=UPI00083224F1|nr:gluconokinase [Nocardia crassostreae]